MRYRERSSKYVLSFRDSLGDENAPGPAMDRVLGVFWSSTGSRWNLLLQCPADMGRSLNSLLKSALEGSFTVSVQRWV